MCLIVKFLWSISPKYSNNYDVEILQFVYPCQKGNDYLLILLSVQILPEETITRNSDAKDPWRYVIIMMIDIILCKQAWYTGKKTSTKSRG